MAGARLVLTDRDRELLHDLYEHRHLALGQVQRLHFLSAQTAARRVRLLAGAGFVKTFRTVGLAERLVTLAPAGAELVADLLAVTPEQLAWIPRSRTPSDYLFFKHFLAVNDAWIALKLACRPGPVSLLGFTPAFHGRRGHGAAGDLGDAVPDPRSGHPIEHEPDAVFALAREGRSALFFLEVDRGTETLSNPTRGVAKLLRFYLAYLASDRYQRHRERFVGAETFRGFRALLATTSAARVAHVRAVGGKLTAPDPRAKRFVWLSTLDNLAPERILAPVWSSLDPTDDAAYALAG